MKRDMELIKKILLRLEESPKGLETDLSNDGYTSEQITYHSYLLIQGGLAEGERFYTHDGSPHPKAILSNLTWQGHEFVDAARNDSIWKKAMERVKERSDAIPIGVLTMLLTSLLKAQLGLT